MPSEAREGRDRAASANVAKAGVDGLLARPLFVVTRVVVATGNVGVGSPTASTSSAGLEILSFLLVLTGGGGAAMIASFSGFGVSPLIGAPGSLTTFVSAVGREPLLCTAITSDGAGAVPFGSLEADEGGRCFVLSTFEWTEFCRALEDAGLAVVDGAGDARAALTVSGKALMTGEEVIDGDMAAPLPDFLLER